MSAPSRSPDSPNAGLPRFFRRVRQLPRFRSAVLCLLAVLCVVVGIGYCLGWLDSLSAERNRIGLDPNSIPRLNDPAVASPTKCLGVSQAVPHTVDALRAEAFLVCKRLEAEFPMRPEPYALMALTHKRYGDTNQAVSCWRNALTKNPDFAPAYLGLGSVAADKGAYAEATTLLEKAVRCNPHQSGAYSLLVEALLREGQTAKALEMAQRFTQQCPTTWQSHFWLGQAYLENKQYDAALASHLKALEFDSTLSSSYYALATACLQLGKRDAAMQYQKQFRTLKETELQKERDQNRNYQDLQEQQKVLVSVYVSAGDLCVTLDHPEEAEAHWLRGIQISPSSHACRDRLIQLLEAQGRIRAALNTILPILDSEAVRAVDWSTCGRLYHKLGDAVQSETAFQESLNRDPDLAEACLGLADLYLQTNQDLTKAESLTEHAVDLNPSAKAYLLLCVIRNAQGHRKDALVAIREAISLAPERRELRDVYARLLQESQP